MIQALGHCRAGVEDHELVDRHPVLSNRLASVFTLDLLQPSLH